MPTLKQKRAFQLITENYSSNNPKPIGQILTGAGYSISTTKQPDRAVVSTKGFQELLKEAGVTDEKISQVMSEGLAAIKPLFKNNNATGNVEQIGEVPDHAIRHKYLETAIKVKGYSVEPNLPKGNTYIQNNINPSAPSAKELAEETLKLLMEKTKRPVDNTPQQIEKDS